MTLQEFYIKDYFKATYIDKESGRNKRFGEIPVIRVRKTRYIYISGKKKRK